MTTALLVELRLTLVHFWSLLQNNFKLEYTVQFYKMKTD